MTDEFRKKIPIFLYVAIIILGMGVLAVGWMNVYLGKQKNISSKVGVKTVAVKKFSDVKKAETVLSWINTQMQADGSLKNGCECVNEACIKCKPDTPDTYAIWPYVLWGQYKYYENTKDNKILEQMNEEADKVTMGGAQYNLWNCKLLKDLYESQILDENFKRKAELVCAQTFYEGNIGEVNGNDFKNELDNGIVNIMNDQAVEFKQVGRFKKSDFQENFVRLATYTSDLCARYLWGLDKELDKKTKAAYYAVLQGYSLSGRNLFNDSLLGITTLDMYRADKEEKYLNLAKFLFEKNKDKRCDGLNQCVYYAFFAKEFFDLAKENSYIEKYNEIVSSLVNTNLDISGLYGFKTNKGGFFSTNFYPTVENALMVGLLSEK